MKISARNVIPGKIKSITCGDLNAEVILDIGGGKEIAAEIPVRSVSDLALTEGKSAYAVIKINNVMVATDE